MEKMQEFGQSPSGGSNRVAYSEANRQAYRYLETLMSDAGLVTRIDVAGNLIGRREGQEPERMPIVSGSHIDTVPNGGHYDGIVGVMAAIEVARTLHDANISMSHPLEIIVWSNEEGGKTGSRTINGSIKPEDIDRPSLGDRSIRDGIRFLDGDPERLIENVRKQGEIAGYVELHVEQGAILDKAAISIGIVDGIVGIRRWNVTVRGFANHAGTTPMAQRHDALLTAALFIAAVRRVITAEPGRQVGTVGRIQAFPGAPNVVPGTVTMSLEIRDVDMQKIDVLFTRIEAAATSLADESGTSFEFDPFYLSPAAITDDRISEIIEISAASLSLEAIHLPSGAGHDAQSIAPIAPIGMIFIPSSKGISHAPDEFTSAQQITDGANVLLQTILRLDTSLP
jgi:N-carbamoyl-L-amino-acid hydrolase